MDNKIKFATLVAKTGVHFGAADGNYDDKERAFVNLFIGYLRVQGGLEEEAESIIAKVTEEKHVLSELVDETNECLKDQSEDERKKTLESMASFIQTIICIDGTERAEELKEFAEWKKALGL